MLVQQDFLRPQMDFEPAWDRLPMFSWMQALSIQIFGANSMAARLPNAIAGILTLLLIYRLGMRLYDSRFGWLWAGAFLGSLLPMLYFRSGIEAPWSGLLMFLGLTHLIFFFWKNEGIEFSYVRSHAWYILMGGLFTGLAILLRGPMVLGLIGITLGVYWLYENLRFYITVQQFFLFFSIALILPLLWISADGLANGPEALTAIFAHQWNLFAAAAEHQKAFWGYYFLLLLFGCFPASIFALRSFLHMGPEREDDEAYEQEQDQETEAQNDFRRWMKILLWVVVLFFTMYSAKAPHFAFLAFFPLTYLAAWTIRQIMEHRIALEPWMKYAILGIGGIYCVAALVLTWQDFFPETFKFWFPEHFLLAQRNAPVYGKGAAVLAAILLAGALIFWRKYMRKGKVTRSVRRLYTGSAGFAFILLVVIVPRIPRFSEGAAIEFAQSKAQEDCYIYPYKYTSNAYLFYGQKSPFSHAQSNNLQWLMFDEVDKQVYFIARGKAAAELQGYSNIEELYRKNGYVFFKRIH